MRRQRASDQVEPGTDSEGRDWFGRAWSPVRAQQAPREARSAAEDPHCPAWLFLGICGPYAGDSARDWARLSRGSVTNSPPSQLPWRLPS